MTQQWKYDVDFPAGMKHTIQVQSNSPDADFNVYVLDEKGNTVAEDTGPEAGAECSLTTKQAGAYVVRIELVSGFAGFSMNVSSSSAPAANAEATPATTPAATATSALSKDEIQGLVDSHNRWRARYNCPPLTWSEELACFAQEWANALGERGMQMQHRSPNEYGENLYWCSGKSANATEVVDAWGSEVEFYDEAKNNWWPKAGHFSQVIWHDTTHVGGGVIRKADQEIWVCNYNPRGNWTGERPYPV